MSDRNVSRKKYNGRKQNNSRYFQPSRKALIKEHKIKMSFRQTSKGPLRETKVYNLRKYRINDLYKESNMLKEKIAILTKEPHESKKNDIEQPKSEALKKNDAGQSNSEGLKQNDSKQPRSKGFQKNDTGKPKSEGFEKNDAGQSYSEGLKQNDTKQPRSKGFQKNDSGKPKSEGFEKNDAGQSNSEGLKQNDTKQPRSKGFQKNDSGKPKSEGLKMDNAGQPKSEGFEENDAGPTRSEGLKKDDTGPPKGENKQTPILTYGRLVKSIEEFYTLAQSIAHFAVKRSQGYFHHFIVVSLNDFKKKVWEYFVCFSTWIKGGGEVQSNDFKEKKEEIENNIEKGNLYVIEDPKYPKTAGEKEKAHERFRKRVGEKAYNLACNNCEHLISYILTGKPRSEQIRKAGKWIMCKVDAASIVINGVWHALKWSGCLLATIPAKRVMSTAISTVVDEVNRVTMKAVMKSSCEMPVQTAKATKTICKGAAKKLGCKTDDILKSKHCVEVANKTSKEALKKTAKIAFVTTGLVEGAFAGYEIYRLNEQRKENHINQHDYKRAVTTTVSGAAGATFGSVGGGVLGQALCPVPGLGFFIGSTAGNLLGRFGASVTAGQIFDEFTSN